MTPVRVWDGEGKIIYQNSISVDTNEWKIFEYEFTRKELLRKVRQLKRLLAVEMEPRRYVHWEFEPNDWWKVGCIVDPTRLLNVERHQHDSTVWHLFVESLTVPFCDMTPPLDDDLGAPPFDGRMMRYLKNRKAQR